MKKLLCLATLSLVACARPMMEPKAAEPEAASAPPGANAEVDETELAAASPEAPVATAGALAEGDFVVMRFSGSFRKEPVTLTQRVVAREGDVLVIDATLTEGKRSETLRVRMRDGAGMRGEIVSVARLDKGVEKPESGAAYDALVAKTLLAADQNEGLVGSAEIDVDVAGAPLKVREATYKVRIGAKEATMRTLESETFPWGDVGAEITTKDGKLLYKAEIVEIGHAAPAPAAVAATSEDD